MAEEFQSKVDSGQARKASSGFSGKGFTFDDSEQSESQQVIPMLGVLQFFALLTLVTYHATLAMACGVLLFRLCRGLSVGVRFRVRSITLTLGETRSAPPVPRVYGSFEQRAVELVRAATRGTVDRKVSNRRLQTRHPSNSSTLYYPRTIILVAVSSRTTTASSPTITLEPLGPPFLSSQKPTSALQLLKPALPSITDDAPSCFFPAAPMFHH